MRGLAEKTGGEEGEVVVARARQVMNELEAMVTDVTALREDLSRQLASDGTAQQALRADPMGLG